ncbi:hypothetical protein FQR65_LT03575 [Abscondita terminalis]|nr:hypothetical protein FQR65_LT03575 [Abscondita terminalis]
MDTIMKSDMVSKTPQYQKHFTDAIEYSVMKEKRFRPPLFLESYKLLEKPENITEKSLHLANILAWCIDLIQGYMNMEDDTMDQSEFRCDDVCWHKKENIGVSSYKDSMFMYESAYVLLEKYFKDKSVYMPLINLFHEMNQRLTIGQSLDWHWRLDRKLDMSMFSRNLFTTIGRNKGGFIIVETAFRAASILSDNYLKFLEIKDLIKEISYAFQVDVSWVIHFDDFYSEISRTIFWTYSTMEKSKLILARIFDKDSALGWLSKFWKTEVNV